MKASEPPGVGKVAKPLFIVMLVISALAFALALVGSTDKFHSLPGYGSDLLLRMNEISCLRSGVNPSDVWTGANTTTSFAPYVDVEAVAAGKKPLYVYTPWAYTFLLPVNLLGEFAGTVVWELLILGSMVLLSVFGYKRGVAVRGEAHDGLLVASFVMMTTAAFFDDAFVMNMGTIITLLVVLMVICLARGHDVLAGICLAGAMMKPQLAMLFVVPLLIKRKFLVLVVGAAICLAATVVPSAMCGASMVDLIAQAPQGGVHAFRGCDLYPWALLCLASSLGMPPSFSIWIGLAVGAVACGAICWRLRRSDDWFSLFLVPATLVTAWTYTTLCSRVMAVFTFAALALMLVRGIGGVRLRFWAVPALVLLLRPFDVVHTFLVFFSGMLADWQIPRELVKPLESGFSVAAFIPAAVIMFLYVFRARRNDCRAPCA